MNAASQVNVRESGEHSLSYTLCFTQLKRAILYTVSKRAIPIVGHDQRDDVRCLAGVLDCDHIIVSNSEHRLCFIEIGSWIRKTAFFNFFRGDLSTKLRIIGKVNGGVHPLSDADLSNSCVGD